MSGRYAVPGVAVCIVLLVLASGCTGGPGTGNVTLVTPGTAVSTGTPGAGTGPVTTTPALVAFVAGAAEFARENGQEKALAAFSDGKGRFVSGNVHVFAVSYNGTLLADPAEPGTVGKNIMEMTDSFGTPFVRNFAETARYGRGYISYTYPDPLRNNTYVPRIAAVEDVDGNYYVAAGMSASEGEVYPSVVLNTAGGNPSVSDLVAYVKDAVAYAKENGKEKAFQAFSNRTGRFVRGELVTLAFDYNGTNLAGPPYSPELSKYHINLVNYHDPDGIDTIRGMRDIAREGGGFLYTVAKVKVDGTEVYLPKIDYAEPVDRDWWLFSGIIVPEYSGMTAANLSKVQVRNHTKEDLHGLVNRTVAYAKVNGKEKTLAAINDPKGPFVSGDLFVWAESTDGTVLADPFFTSGIRQNFMGFTDSNGVKTTQVGISSMKDGTGFSHAMFPDTASSGTAEVPKLVYMMPVDDSWWIGGGIYGVQVE
jgi:polar amino acid transport system substrate-binding protein